MRLLAGLLAGQNGRFELVGDASLSSRPMERVAEPLRRMGAHVETLDGHAPVVVEGGALQAIDYELPVPSAQVKSAVLLAGLYAERETTVVEPLPTRDHTERLLERAGASVRRRPQSVTVSGTDKLSLENVEIPGDFSSAAALLVAAVTVPGSDVTVHGVGLNPRRIGLLDILERMGARVAIYNRRPIGGEPAGDVQVRSSELVGATVTPAEVPALVDELPLARSRRLPRAGRDRRQGCSRAAREGVGPDRGGGRGAAPDRSAHSRHARRLPGPRCSRPPSRRRLRRSRRSPAGDARRRGRSFLA